MAHRTIALATELRERSAYRHELGTAPRRERFDVATARGFEPLRAEPNGFLVHHLNHSVTLSQAAVGRSPSMHRRPSQKWRASGIHDFALRPSSFDPWRCAHEMHCIARQAMAIRDRVWYAFRVGDIVGVLL